MLLDYIGLGGMNFGNWAEYFLWMANPASNFIIIVCVLLILFLFINRLRGFWAILVYLIAGGVVFVCLWNIIRLWQVV